MLASKPDNASSQTAETANHKPVIFHQLAESTAHLDNMIPPQEPTRAKYATSQMDIKLRELVLLLSVVQALELVLAKELSATRETLVLTLQVPACIRSQ